MINAGDPEQGGHVGVSRSAVPVLPSALRTSDIASSGRARLTLPLVLMGTAVGTLLIAIGFAASRSHYSWAAVPFWLGWIASLLILATAITTPTLTPKAGVFIVTVEAAQQSLVRWMYSPLSFTFPDELQHWRTASDILAFHHLFHSNPPLPVSPVFPGLEEVATSLVLLTHIGLFPAGLIVAAVCHIALSAAAFYLFRRVSDDACIAGVAAFLFALNPLHSGFDSMFIYQAPALLLGMVAVETALDRQNRDRQYSRTEAAISLICLAGLIITHHLTGAVFIGTLAAVGVLLAVFTGLGPMAKRAVALAVVGVLLADLWVSAEARPVLNYLGTPLQTAFSGVLHFGGQAGTVALPATTQGTPGAWLTVVGTIITAVLILAGAAVVWRRTREDGHQPLPGVFAICAFSYFGVLLVREFAPDGAELAGRLLTFAALFTSVTMAFALVPTWPVREKLRRLIRPAAIAAILGIFLGSKMSGWPAPWEQLPGTFHVAGFESGIDRQNLAAVHWFRTRVGFDRRVVCDISICSLVGAYAQATPIPDEARLYYTPDMSRSVVHTIHKRGLDYLFVDLRMSRETPITGHFFHTSTSESGAQDHPVPLAGLTKFRGFPGIQLIYDSGPIQIYDLRELPYE